MSGNEEKGGEVGEVGAPSRPGSAGAGEGAGEETTPPDQEPQGQSVGGQQHESDADEEVQSVGGESGVVIGRPRAVPERGYWGSRPPSPGGSESSNNNMPAKRQPKYDSLNYWRAKRVIFYKNGDPYFPGLEYRFRPGRDVTTMEGLLDRLSVRLDLPRGARFIFTMEGLRMDSLDDLEDGHSYVVSSYKTFKPRDSADNLKKAWLPWKDSGPVLAEDCPPRSTISA